MRRSAVARVCGGGGRPGRRCALPARAFMCGEQLHANSGSQLLAVRLVRGGLAPTGAYSVKNDARVVEGDVVEKLDASPTRVGQRQAYPVDPVCGQPSSRETGIRATDGVQRGRYRAVSCPSLAFERRRHTTVVRATDREPPQEQVATVGVARSGDRPDTTDV